MFGVIPRNLKKTDVSISNRFPGVHKRGIHIYTHTHTHTQTHTLYDSMRRNAMRCISPKNHISLKKIQVQSDRKFFIKISDNVANCISFRPCQIELKKNNFSLSRPF